MSEGLMSSESLRVLRNYGKLGAGVFLILSEGLNV
jgi:hypothetical protein